MAVPTTIFSGSPSATFTNAMTIEKASVVSMNCFAAKIGLTTFEEERFREFREGYGIALGFGLALAALAFLLEATLVRRLP